MVSPYRRTRFFRRIPVPILTGWSPLLNEFEERKVPKGLIFC